MHIYLFDQVQFARHAALLTGKKYGMKDDADDMRILALQFRLGHTPGIYFI